MLITQEEHQITQLYKDVNKDLLQHHLLEVIDLMVGMKIIQELVHQ